MSAPEPPAAQISLFYSYSHKDEALRKKLETHLSLLQTQGVIGGWHDRRIEAGTEWDGIINENLDRAGMILLLVSADFLASRYCRDVEVTQAMERHEAGTARVIPVILRPVDWHTAPFGKLQSLPRDGKPVTKWSNRDEAFTDIARGIREAAKGLNSLARSREGEPPGEPIRDPARTEPRPPDTTSGQSATAAPNPPTPARPSPTVATPAPQPAGTIDRKTLVRTVSGFAPSDMATFVALIEGAARHVGRHGTIPEQAAELFGWAESSAGPGLEAIRRALEDFLRAR
jgi:hypothetical protein